MNVALIFAGGTGQRMNTATRPKQFLELHGKPIIVYTLEQFENHPFIDGIVVACLEEWIPFLQKLLLRYDLNKVIDVVPGGKTGQESIKNGLDCIVRHYANDTVVLVHDGVRPLIDEKTISNCIDVTKKTGSAITVAPAIETIIQEKDGQISEVIDRKNCQLARAPQCFRLGDLCAAHQRAHQEGRLDFIDSASMMKHYGHHLHVVEGPIENIKITTPLDFYIFRAILDARENSQIFGL